jgi:AsmA protein
VRALKWILWIAGGLLVLLLIGVGIIAATFDPNQYKPQIIELVKQRTGRTLTMDGNIGLAFFPKIGAEVERLTLSEPQSTRTFAKIEEARVALALLPLLSKQVIVDQITLAGLTVDLIRFKDGRTNFDDLTGTKPDKRPADKKAEAPSAPFTIDIGGIALKDATIRWRDERDGTDVRLSNVSLKTGRIASGVPAKLDLEAKIEGTQPKMNAQVDLAAGYRLEFDKGAFALSVLDLKVIGDVPGLAGLDARLKGDMIGFDPAADRVNLSGVELLAKSKDGLDAKFLVPKLQLAPDRAESKTITGHVKLARPGQIIDAKLQLSALEAKETLVRFSRFDVDLDAKMSDLAVQGKFGSPVTLDLTAQQAQLPGIAGDLTLSGPNIPGKSLRAAVKGGARADWGKKNANLELAAKLDESNLQAKLGITNWAQPVINFDLAADRLNVDRYFPPKKQASAPAPQSGGGPKTVAAGEQPIDLAALKNFNATGAVKVGALQASNIKATNVNIGIKAAGGKLDVDPISASVYQGTLAGSVNVNANTNVFAVKQNLAGISVGPLLRDALDKDVLEGRGNVTLDVTANGTTVEQLKRALGGTASLALKDGAIKGVDIPGAIRKAKALLGSKSALESQARGGEKTDFSDLTASFVIKDGIAHNDDLQARSPGLRITGVGDINIGAGTLDYLVNASVVATSTGQGGKDLAQVAGLTAPVRLTGPLENPKYTVDVAALATDAAKEVLARELERRLGGGKGGEEKGAPSRGGAAEELLRGIFGKPK